jgi:hypothetical protein
VWRCAAATGGPDVRFLGGVLDFIILFFYKTSRSAVGSSLWVPSDCLLVGKAASCVRVKNEWRLLLVPLYAFMAWSVKWLDCKTVVQCPTVVLLSVAISLGLRRVGCAAEHSAVVSRLHLYTSTRIFIVYGEQAELYLLYL